MEDRRTRLVSHFSKECADWLDRPFSKEEIHNVVLQLNKDQALEPDGFTMDLYQECWEMIKDDLLRVFLEFNNNWIINQSTNTTFIALVPKKSQMSRIFDFQPIYWVTCLYKIIAKVLSRRLCKVIWDAIFMS